MLFIPKLASDKTYNCYSMWSDFSSVSYTHTFKFWHKGKAYISSHLGIYNLSLNFRDTMKKYDWKSLDTHLNNKQLCINTAPKLFLI